MRDIDRSRPREKMSAHQAEGREVVRIPYPIGSRTVTVLRRARVTDRMVRLTLGGEGLDGMHTYQADDHVKVVFPNADGILVVPQPNDREMLTWTKDIGPTRDYTIRRYDAEARELDLDLVLHAGGLASEWAVSAEIGSQVALAGPPGAKAWAHTYDYYVVVGDSTAFPAIGRWLSENPNRPTRVVATTEHPSQREYPFELGSRGPVTWVERADDPDEVIAAVEALVGEGRGFLFAGGETDFIKPLRRWSKGKLDSVITGYWKRGVSGYDDD